MIIICAVVGGIGYGVYKFGGGAWLDKQAANATASQPAITQETPAAPVPEPVRPKQVEQTAPVVASPAGSSDPALSKLLQKGQK